MATEATPILLLDVDGVVNAISRRPPKTFWPEWVTTTANAGNADYPILASRAVLDFLTAVHERGLADVRWHTTWREAARSSLAPVLGLPDWPIAEAPEFEGNHGGYGSHKFSEQPRWWKLAAAERVLADTEVDLIWLDDDIDFEPGVRRSGLRGSTRVLAISPHSNVGLLRKHLIAIAERLGAPDLVPPAAEIRPGPRGAEIAVAS